MKTLTGFLVVLTLLSIACLAQAGERAGAVSISPYIGGYQFDEEQALRRNRLEYGLRLGYDLTDNLEAELVGNYVNAELKGTDNHLAAWSYRLDFLYNFMPHSVVVPYLAMGGGGETIEFKKSGGGDATDGTFNFGGGVKFFLNDDFALRLDARHVLDVSYKTLHNWDYSAGISFLFGGAKAAAAVVTPAPEAPPEVPPVTPMPGHYKYCVTLHIEFDIDRALIRPEYRDEIARVGDFMKKYPSTSAVIEGHTDNVWTYEHNMDLSQRRAESVVNYLVDNFGIDRSRLTAKGYGYTRPVADNATNEGRQKNRRIEAIIDCTFDVKPIQPPPEKLCMGLVVDFDSGKADVKPEYREEIAKVADFMKENPTTTAVIEGHTDNVGSPEENLKLSQQRAENVVNYLVDNFGIDRARLSAKGYGDTRRIAYNATAEGRAMNRRIDAVIDCVIKK